MGGGRVGEGVDRRRASGGGAGYAVTSGAGEKRGEGKRKNENEVFSSEPKDLGCSDRMTLRSSPDYDQAAAFVPFLDSSVVKYCIDHAVLYRIGLG